jgi:hypothetical protein
MTEHPIHRVRVVEANPNSSHENPPCHSEEHAVHDPRSVSNRWRSRMTLVLPLISILAIAGVGFSTSTTAQAQVRSDADLEQDKAHWQGLYRKALQDVARLKRDAARHREAYAKANRRNYRRGTARHDHRLKAEEAEKALALAEKKLADFADEARRGGALPGWLYEVEDEPVELANPPSD